MADYLPYAMPGEVVTFLADGAVTGGNVLQVGAADMDAKLAVTAATATWIGVAAKDAADNVEVAVHTRGPIHKLIADGAITRGDLVEVGGVDGSVKTTVAVTSVVVGVALESIADTARGRIMLV